MRFISYLVLITIEFMLMSTTTGQPILVSMPPRNYLLSLPFTDPLKTAIKEGKHQGLKIYAWYEHGMMTFPNATSARQHPDWILSTNNNKKLIDNHWWLDPANPEVQQYFY